MLYAELACDGGVGVEGEYQKAINKMGRPTLSAIRPTPLEIGSGGEEKGVSYYDRRSRSGPGNGYVKSRRCLMGSGKPLPRAFGPHEVVNK